MTDIAIKGYLFSVLASLLLASGFILNVFALREGINPETGSLFSFIFAFFVSLAMVAFSGKMKGLVPAYRKYLKPMAVMGVINGIAAITWFYALSLLGPSLLGFLLNFSAVFTVALSIAFLKERFSMLEGLGGIMALAGALIITYSNGMLLGGAIFALVSSILFAISSFMAKIYIGHVPPLYINNIRTFFMLGTILLYGLLTGSIQMPNVQSLVFLFFAALAAPVLSLYLYYRSIEIADLSKITLIRSMDPLVIALMSAYTMGEILKDTQLSGGIVIMFGIVLIGLARYRPKIIAKWVP